MNPLFAVIIAVGVLVTLPITLPIAVAQQLIFEKRKTKRAQSFVCFKCQKILGVASIERADSAWQEYMSARMQEGIKLRVIRTIWAICVCGQEYGYNEKDDIFELTAESF